MMTQSLKIRLEHNKYLSTIALGVCQDTAERVYLALRHDPTTGYDVIQHDEERQPDGTLLWFYVIAWDSVSRHNVGVCNSETGPQLTVTSTWRHPDDLKCLDGTRQPPTMPCDEDLLEAGAALRRLLKLAG
jgi:hypothetical protein